MVRRARIAGDESRSDEMTVGTLLLVCLVLVLFGVIPGWPHSKSWGYAPGGVVGLLLVVVVIMLVTGNL